MLKLLEKKKKQNQTNKQTNPLHEHLCKVRNATLDFSFLIKAKSHKEAKATHITL